MATEILDVEFVNREEQLTRVHSMRAGTEPARMLLIKGEGGLGKTWVLRRVQRDHADLPNALLDLGLPYGQDPLELVRGLREQMGGVDWRQVDTILQGAEATLDFQGCDQRILYTSLTELFSLEELRMLCFDLQVDFDELGGEVKSAKARELILYMARRPGGMRMLVEEVRKERPDTALAEWGTTGGAIVGVRGAGEGRENELRLKLLATELEATLALQPREIPALFLLDSYDKCTRAVWDWLEQAVLLPIRAGKLQGVLVVVAGRDTPVLDREWRGVCSQTELRGLRDDAVRDYWLERRRQPSESLSFAIEYSGGIPLMLANMADIRDQQQFGRQVA